jgi:hypothetical protein
MSFMTIMQTILGILDNHPLCNEPGYHQKFNHPAVAAYTKYVQYVCARETIEHVLEPLYAGKGIKHPFADMFADEIRMWFEDHREQYVSHMFALADVHDNSGAKVGTGGTGCYGNKSYIDKPYNYAELAEKLTNLP